MLPRRSGANAPVAGFGLLAAAVYATAGAAVTSPAWERNPALGSLAVTLDLVLFLPFFFWLLVVRRKRLPPVTVVPAFFLSLAGAALVLPDDGERYLRVARATAPAVQAALLVLVALHAAGVRRAERQPAPRAQAAAPKLAIVPRRSPDARNPARRPEQSASRIALYVHEPQKLASELTETIAEALV